jgi:hypothetical protein
MISKYRPQTVQFNFINPGDSGLQQVPLTFNTACQKLQVARKGRWKKGDRQEGDRGRGNRENTGRRKMKMIIIGYHIDLSR